MGCGQGQMTPRPCQLEERAEKSKWSLWEEALATNQQCSNAGLLKRQLGNAWEAALLLASSANWLLRQSRSQCYASAGTGAGRGKLKAALGGSAKAGSHRGAGSGACMQRSGSCGGAVCARLTLSMRFMMPAMTCVGGGLIGMTACRERCTGDLVLLSGMCTRPHSSSRFVIPFGPISQSCFMQSPALVQA